MIRQAHPGEDCHAYVSYEEKLEDAREYKRLEELPWDVLVDDYEGTVHRAYSCEMADPTFLIDAGGRVAFYGMWTHVPTLRRALDELLERSGRNGAVAGGIDRRPHLLASIADGYRGPRRGGRRGVLEYDLATGGAGTLSFLGNKAKPLLAPIALRTTPLSPPAKAALGAGALLTLGLAAYRVLKPAT